MSQLSLYIGSQDLAKIGSAARREKVSISKWVRRRILGALHRDWTPGYFDLFGSVSDKEFRRPAQPSGSAGIPREAL